MMKRMLRIIGLLFLFLCTVGLIACSSSETITLRGDIEDFANDVEIILEAKDEEVQSMQYVIASSYSDMNITKEEEKEMEEEIRLMYGSLMGADGMGVNVNYGDTEMELVMYIDFREVNQSDLSEYGFENVEDGDLELENMMMQLEEAGFERES
ncbi:DUF1307 domain-containing protein [Oceanobacillus jeddahense]|uniref:DUF1307 domain-containing protein n=1 Tax=Oceanobacillus jeddahense TaxID=1462527 RepID=UPI00362E7BCC